MVGIRFIPASIDKCQEIVKLDIYQGSKVINKDGIDWDDIGYWEYGFLIVDEDGIEIESPNQVKYLMEEWITAGTEAFEFTIVFGRYFI